MDFLKTVLQNKIRFVIAGGGTAGWIAALYLKLYFPKSSITLIESSEIGILGAGEGTTPHFVTFLEQVGISKNNFIKNTKATIKTGIKFTNWHGDNSHYFHPFLDNNTGEPEYNEEPFLIGEIAGGKTLNDICLSNVCSEQNKVKFYLENDVFKIIGWYAFHFDARLAAEYLKKVSIDRGITHIDSKIVSSIHNEENLNVTGLILENGQSVDCDFLFDCTGFSRKIIGGIFNEKWIDYTESLPVNRALPFFIENTTNVIPPYTEAIAMKYGWIWKIPVQGRYGCGYVFDSSYVSDEEVKKEIVELFGEVNIPRNFSFKAGFYKNLWVKNCVCLGLASGFIEPLEATSIWTTIRALRVLFEKYPITIFTNNEKEKESYNEEMRKFNEEVKDFIQLHYITKRNDSPFWKEYKTKNLIAERIKKFYNVKTLDEYLNLHKKNFPFFETLWVFDGVKIFNSEIFNNGFKDNLQKPEHYNYQEQLNNFKKNIIKFADFKAIDHYKFLEHLKQL